MTHDSIGERHYKDTIEAVRRLEQYLSEQKPPPTYPDRTTLIITGIRICQMMRASLQIERETCSPSPDFDLFQLCATYRKHLKSLEEQILDFIPLIDPFAQPFEIVEPIKASIQKFEQSFALILRSYSMFLASIKGPTNGTLKGDHPCRKWRHQFMPSPFSSGSL